jgi:hypothetical protein
MLAFVSTGRTAAAGRLQLELHATALEGRASAAMTARDVALPLALGVRAFARQDFDTAVEQLNATRDTAHRFGGSHAQRDLLSLTLIEAARRAGRPRLASHILAERQMLKPTAWSERIARRIADEDTGHQVPVAA